MDARLGEDREIVTNALRMCAPSRAILVHVWCLEPGDTVHEAHKIIPVIVRQDKDRVHRFGRRHLPFFLRLTTGRKTACHAKRK
ncbi:MAG: hypothetical protein LBL07_16605 [Tannerella sp.]|nr:hypothetical protein [Tannerella sp.]